MREPLLRRGDSPPLAIGERIVSNPFDHYGVVGPNSTRTICEVVLDEPLPHTNRVWSSWDEIEREGDHEIAQAQRWVKWAESDLQTANQNLSHARAHAEKCRKELATQRRALRAVQKRFA